MAIEDRVMIFIDGSNVYFALKAYRPRKVDFHRLMEKLCNGRRLIRAHFYGCQLPPDDPGFGDQQKFISALNSIPRLDVFMGNLQVIRGTRREKGVDVRLAVHMITKAFQGHFDVAVLVSGDNDFVPVVEAVKEQGRVVEVAFPRVARALRNAADTYVLLNEEYLRDCWLQE